MNTHSAPVSPTAESETAAVSSVEPQGKWLINVRIVSFLTLISRLLGLVRDMGMAAVFGNGPLLDSFTLAYRLPNLCRRLFGEGALTTAFLPEFLRADKQHRDQGQQLASAVFVILLGLLTTLVLAGELFLFWRLQMGGLSAANREIYLLTAGLFPYVIMICLAAQLGAMLHAKGEFTIPALVPSRLNVVWIAALWGVVPYLETDSARMQAVVVSILLGGLIQFLFPALYLYCAGFRFRTDWRLQIRQARKVFQLMLPIVLGLSVTQLNAICDSTLAWWYSQPEQGEWVAPGTASALYFGQRMYQFPLGVFGVALGTVLFARLAHHAEAGKRELISHDVLEGTRLVLLLGLPSTVGMMLLAEPLTDVLLKRGAFDEEDVRQTAATVFAYGTAIWAFLGINVIQRVYFALEDSLTPVRIGLGIVGLNVMLNFLFLFLLGGSGLAYATAVSAIVQFCLLMCLLRSRIPLKFDSHFWLFLFKTGFSTAVMGGVCSALSHWTNPALVHWPRFLTLVLPLTAATLVYFGCLRVLGVQELSLLLGRKLSRMGSAGP